MASTHAINSQSKSNVLYYSVKVNDYISIINLVNDSLCDSNDIDSGIFIKTDSSFDKFNAPMTDDIKKSINDKFANHIEKLKTGNYFMIHNNNMYVINPEFHITTLFVGGKINEKCIDMEAQFGQKVSITINKLGVSDNFIALSVHTIKTNDNSEIAYYGNPVKHITVALNKTGKKVLPKDSYTALIDGKIYDIDAVFNGQCDKV